MLTMRKTIEKKKKAKTKITHKHTIDNIDTHTHTHEQQQQKTVMDAEKSTKLNEYWKWWQYTFYVQMKKKKTIK